MELEAARICRLYASNFIPYKTNHEEVESIFTEDKGAAMNWGFCNENYNLEEAHLQQILDEYKK